MTYSGSSQERQRGLDGLIGRLKSLGVRPFRRLLWALVPPLVCATFIAYSLQISAGAIALTEPYFINRVLAAVTLLLTAGLLHAWIVAVDALDARNKLLNGRNAELQAANRELVVRDEQIARQNEELELRRRAAEGGERSKIASRSASIRPTSSAWIPAAITAPNYSRYLKGLIQFRQYGH